MASELVIAFALLARGLAGLAANDLVAVLDALALVGIGLAQRADLGSGLADLLAIDAGDGDVAGLGFDGDVDPFRNRELHRMRVAELEHHLAALDLGAVTDADDVELALEAFAHTLDVVGHERAHEPVEGTGFPLVVLPLELDHVVVDLHGNAGDDRRGQGALGTLHEDVVAFLTNLDAFRQGKLFLSDTRHVQLLTRPGRGLRRRRPGARPRYPRARPWTWRRWRGRVRPGPRGSLPCRDKRDGPGARRARCRE